MICPNDGTKMDLVGVGSRRVKYEADLVHTSSYRCPVCGHHDFAPKLAADLEKK